LYIDNKRCGGYVKDAFTHPEDRATLGSDLSAGRDLAKREWCRQVSLFFDNRIRQSLSLWKTISEKPWEIEGEAFNRPQA
jgi:hypothetical protein